MLRRSEDRVDLFPRLSTASFLADLSAGRSTSGDSASSTSSSERPPLRGRCSQESRDCT